MKESIKALINVFIFHEDIFCSWGSKNFEIYEESLHFDVDAFKYKGGIQIVPCTDSKYNIVFSNYIFNGAALENVVSIIDEYVEVTDDYLEDLLFYIRDGIY